MRGHGNQQFSARLQDACNSFECSLIVRNVFDDIQCRHHVVKFVRNASEFRQWRGQHVMTQPLLRHFAGDVVDLESIDRSERPEHREIVTGAAADLEQLRILWKGDLSANELRNDLPPRTVPPVPLIMFRHRFVD